MPPQNYTWGYFDKSDFLSKLADVNAEILDDDSSYVIADDLDQIMSDQISENAHLNSIPIGQTDSFGWTPCEFESDRELAIEAHVNESTSQVLLIRPKRIYKPFLGLDSWLD